MKIDFHTHCFPDALAERVIPLLAGNADIKAYLNGKISDLLASMKRSGIDRSVLLQIATKPTQNHTVNSWAIERNEPGIVAFGSIHPLGEDWSAELDRLAAAGIKGIKFHPEYQGFYVDADFMKPVYRRIRDLGLIVVFHAGVDVGVPPPVHGAPHHFAKILDLLPPGRTVLAHMGGWNLWDDVEKFLIGTHLIFDTSFCHDYMNEEQMKRMIRNHGADKIVMGSDSPWDDQSKAVEDITCLHLSQAEEDAILGGNATRLLSSDGKFQP